MAKRVRLFLVMGMALALVVGFTYCSGGGGGGKPKKPKILSVNPASGPEAGGTTVTIGTKNFKEDFTTLGNLPIVNFGASSATNVTAVDADTVTADTPQGPAGGGTVDVEVVSAVSGKSARMAGAFNYTPAPPNCNITGVIPAQGTSNGGTAVIISGTNFEDPSTVTFGGVTASNFVYFSANQIGCDTPVYPAGGPVDVRVVSANRDCTLTNGYTYILPPTCTITLPLAPNNGPLAGGTTVQISGTGFDATTTATFGGVSASVSYIAPTLITAVSPADPLGIPAGNYDVAVAVTTGAGANCNQPNAFHYNAVTINCNILSINPTNGDQGGGTAVVITGTSFMPLGITDPTVLFGGTAATVTAATDTQIDVVTPAALNPGVVDVQVNNETGGTCVTVGGFTYDPPVGPQCTITSITPNTGDAAGGTAVTIVGTNFDPISTGVFFDGVPATNILATATTIDCNTPAGASVGFVDVDIVPASGQPCTAVNGFEYTGCTFTVSPNQGQPPGGNVVTITGVGIEANTAQAFFGGVESPLYVARPGGSITCEVPPSPLAPPGVGPVDVQVVNPIAGTNCTVVGAYTYVGCAINSVTPSSGPKVSGVSATISGSGFDINGAMVRFGLTYAEISSVVVVDPSTITCEVPPSCTEGTVDVEVINNNGHRCLLTNAYTYLTPGSPTDPVVTSINPTSAGLSGGVAATITGTGFDTNGAAVLFVDPVTGYATVATNVVVVTSTQITCDVPPTPIPNGTGFVDVLVINDNGGCGTGAGIFEYILGTTCNPCNAVGMNPDPVANPINVMGEASARTINGNEFCVGQATDVWFIQTNTALGTVQNVTATTVDVQCPAAPDGAGPVTIFVQSGPFICGPIMGEYQ